MWVLVPVSSLLPSQQPLRQAGAGQQHLRVGSFPTLSTQGCAGSQVAGPALDDAVGQAARAGKAAQACVKQDSDCCQLELGQCLGRIN